MTKRIQLLLLLQFIIGFNLKSQVDSVTFQFEADISSSRYEIVEIPRITIPTKLIVLNCTSDTFGIWTSFRIDSTLQLLTLHVEKNELSEFTYDIQSSCEYRYGLKHGLQIDYFDFETIKGVCISANPLIKVKGNWKKGQKHGKWTYYKANGMIDKIEVYKKNKKIKTVANTRL